jgi:hypothetical protein
MPDQPRRAPDDEFPRTHSLVSRTWWRADQCSQRAYDAARQLLSEIAQWEDGTGVDIVLAGARGQATLTITQFGIPQPFGEDGIRHALRNVLKLASQVERPHRGGKLVEIVRNPLRAYPALPGETLTDTEAELKQIASLSGVPTTVWPTPRLEAGTGLFDALLLQPGSYLQFLIAPAEPIEHHMLIETMRTTFGRVDGWEFDDYLGTPVRLRAFVGGDSAVSATLRAAVLSLGTGLRAVPVDPEEARALASPTPDALAGHTVPTAMALSMLRIPAVGLLPQQGVASELPRPKAVPLDPVPPRPRQAIRLGSAFTVAGKRVSAWLDISDLTRHTFVEGRTGAGKTTYIAELIAELSRARIGYTLLDLHGSGVDAALRTVDTDQPTMVVRHSDTAQPIPVNLLSPDPPMGLVL